MLDAWKRHLPGQPPPITALDLLRASGITPDPWQQAVLGTPGNQLWLWHRQCGKSTTVAAMGLEDACAADGQLILLVSRSLRQSGELFRKVEQFYQQTQPYPLRRHTALSLELSNGSRIVSLPGTEETIVGYSSVRRVILDEAARIPDGVYFALRPMLAMSGGSLVALSTPWGKRGWFFDAWEGTQDTDAALDRATADALLADLGIRVLEDPPDAQQPRLTWTRSQVTAPENPRLSPYFLANERREVPDLIFRQEWLCEFVDTQDMLFRYEDVQAMVTDDVEPLFMARPFAERALAEQVLPLFGGR